MKFNRTGIVEMVDEPEPQSGANETILQVAFAGICGSDLHGILEGGYRKPPLIMGHEFSGTTPDGRRVAVRATLGCGHCDLCTTGYEQVCHERTIIGIDRQGGFAEQVSVPNEAIVELPSNASMEKGALAEPLAVALRAWNRSGADSDMRVGIIGAGGIGLLLLTVASYIGAASISIVDLKPARLDLAKKNGATETGGTLEGEHDVIFDAVGTPKTHASSIAHLRPGGTAVWLGCRDADPGFNALDFIRSERSVLTSFAYNAADFEAAVQMLPSLSFNWIDVRPLSDAARVFMDLVNGNLDSGRVLVQP